MLARVVESSISMQVWKPGWLGRTEMKSPCLKLIYIEGRYREEKILWMTEIFSKSKLKRKRGPFIEEAGSNNGARLGKSHCSTFFCLMIGHRVQKRHRSFGQRLWKFYTGKVYPFSFVWFLFVFVHWIYHRVHNGHRPFTGQCPKRTT